MSRLPSLKGLTNRQLLQLAMKMEKRQPGILTIEQKASVAEEPRKLTKREQEIARAREAARSEGFDAATRQFKYAKEEQERAFQQKRKELQLDTLRTIRDLASAYGQMMGEVARAMQSEKDQL